MAFRIHFYKGTRSGVAGLYNRFVRFWTIGKYSHVEIEFNHGVWWSSSFSDHGVRPKLITLDPLKWDSLDLPGRFEIPALKWFIDHEGEEYDLLANLRFGFGFVQEERGKWMCAESCAAALGFVDPWRFEPNNLYSVIERLGRKSE